VKNQLSFQYLGPLTCTEGATQLFSLPDPIPTFEMYKVPTSS
jgi:hypothetical protein